MTANIAACSCQLTKSSVILYLDSDVGQETPFN